MGENEARFSYRERDARPSKAERRRARRARDCTEARDPTGTTPTAFEVESKRESEGLASALREEDLELFVISGDGNCLYRALSHQLTNSGCPTDHRALRVAVAQHMRAGAARFLPFTQCESQAEFEALCDSTEELGSWGGELELVAASEAVGRAIILFGAEGRGPVYTAGDAAMARPPLRVAFQRHYLAAGAHYNSIVPRQ
eukprot:Polyplicarium_translucidae@DN2103_c0_g1_i2.p1